MSAELWGLVHGLRLAKSLAIQVLLVEMDSNVVVTMVEARRTHCCLQKPLLDEVIQLLTDLNWSCSFAHVFHEASQLLC